MGGAGAPTARGGFVVGGGSGCGDNGRRGMSFGPHPLQRRTRAAVSVLAGHALLATAVLSLAPALPRGGSASVDSGLSSIPVTLLRVAPPAGEHRPAAQAGLGSAVKTVAAGHYRELAVSDSAAALAAPSAAASPEIPLQAATAATATAAVAVPATVATTPITLRSAHADHANCPSAPYPALLRERGVEGVVRVMVRVNAEGRAAEARVAQGSGFRLFDEAAVQRALACRFVPARRGDEAVEGWVDFPVRFALLG